MLQVFKCLDILKIRKFQLHFRWETLAGQLAIAGVGSLLRIFVHNSFVDSKVPMLMVRFYGSSNLNILTVPDKQPNSSISVQSTKAAAGQEEVLPGAL